MQRMKAASLGNMLEKTPARLKNPETSECVGSMSIKGVNLVKTPKDTTYSRGKPPSNSWSNANPENSSQIWPMSLIEGKDEKIKGIVKKPKSQTSQSANIVKVLRYLRAFPKMPNTYICSEKEIMEGSWIR